jgi:hypothetical protein
LAYDLGTRVVVDGVRKPMPRGSSSATDSQQAIWDYHSASG